MYHKCRRGKCTTNVDAAIGCNMVSWQMLQNAKVGLPNVRSCKGAAVQTLQIDFKLNDAADGILNVGAANARKKSRRLAILYKKWMRQMRTYKNI